MSCPCTKENLLASYKGLKKEVSRRYPHLSELDIKIETATIFRIWDQENQSYEKPEAVYDGPEFKIVGGDIYYPKCGVTLDSLHQNQLNEQPQLYSVVDHQTSVGIREAFINGANFVVTSYHREGSDNRDIIVMTLDRDTGIGQTKIINTTVNGTYHTFENIQKIAQQEFPDLIKAEVNDKIFFLTDKKIQQEKLVRAIERVEVNSDRFIDRNIDSRTVDLPESIIPTQSKDVVLTAGNVIEYVNLKNYQERRDNWEPTKENNIQKISRNSQAIERQVVFKRFERIKLTKTIEKKIKKTIEALVLIKETNVGIGTIYLFIKKLAIDKPTKIDLNSKIQSDQVRKKSFKPQLKFDSNQISKFQIENFKAKIKEQDKADLEIPKIKNKHETKKNNQIKFLEKTYGILSKITKVVRKLEKLFKLTHKNNLNKSELRLDNSITSPDKHKNIKKNILIHKFIQGYLLWMLIKLSTFPMAQDTKQIDTTKYLSDKKSEKIQPENSGNFLLAAIIWYLAQIREQGYIRTHTKRKKKNNRKIESRVIYQYYYS